jgi:hypothetical protein
MHPESTGKKWYRLPADEQNNTGQMPVLSRASILIETKWEDGGLLMPAYAQARWSSPLPGCATPDS